MRKQETLSLLKGLAIFSVICAHCYTIPANTTGFGLACSLLIHNIGTLGVLCFFVVSGYLYNCENITRFWIKKAKWICLPWLV